MSEVIYKEDNYEKILKVLQKCLHPAGVAILASKMYYFGVGGSVLQFEEYIQKQYSHLFSISTLKHITDKRNNKRVIL